MMKSYRDLKVYKKAMDSIPELVSALTIPVYPGEDVCNEKDISGG